jgi:hypothetical protein
MINFISTLAILFVGARPAMSQRHPIPLTPNDCRNAVATVKTSGSTHRLRTGRPASGRKARLEASAQPSVRQAPEDSSKS